MMTNHDARSSLMKNDLLPLLPEVGVLALVPDHWNWQWQQRHQVLTRLAHYFPVVWMNPAEDWRRALHFRKPSMRSEETPIAEKGFLVHTPAPWFPAFYSPRWLARLTFRKRLENAREALLRMGSEKVVLYIWRPEFAAALDCVPFDLSCYHIDDEYTFSPTDLPTPDSERRLLKTVGQVFIHSPALLAKKGGFNPNTTFVPNGVDYHSFSRSVPEPLDLAPLPRPKIGYAGHVKRQLDWSLLSQLSEQRTAWQFVFVGERSPHPDIVPMIETLSRRPNVHFLGAKTSAELAQYPQHFDVCIMPYRVDDYTKYIYPLKLHEYLASGRPVVGTKLPLLEAYVDVIGLAENAAQWVEQLARALRPDPNAPSRCEERQALARQHDWGTLVELVARTMAQRLGPPYAERLSQALGGAGIPVLTR